MSKCSQCGVRLRRVFKTDAVCTCERVKRGRKSTNTIRKYARVTPERAAMIETIAAAHGIEASLLFGAIINKAASCMVFSEVAAEITKRKHT